MKVCYVLAYRDPGYIRTRTLLNALDSIEGLDVFPAINTDCGVFRYVETFIAALRIKRKNQPDCFIIGFRGHEIFWLIRLIAGKKAVLFDGLMSPYAALHEEGKLGWLGKLLSIPIRWIEHSILHNADAVLTDTRLHQLYYERFFQINSDKVIPLPVGAVEQNVFRNMGSSTYKTCIFNVLFYGSFLPLHGIDIILRAAARLGNLPIHFNFIGGNDKSISNFRRLCAKLKLQNYTHRKWVGFNQLLREEIPHSDICLGGPFGNTLQAQRVVTGKTSQCLALRKATVVGRIDEDYGFVDKNNCLLVEQGSDAALADALRWAYLNSDKLTRIGEQGFLLYEMRFSLHVVRRLLEQNLCRFFKDLDA